MSQIFYDQLEYEVINNAYKILNYNDWLCLDSWMWYSKIMIFWWFKAISKLNNVTTNNNKRYLGYFMWSSWSLVPNRISRSLNAITDVMWMLMIMWSLSWWSLIIPNCLTIIQDDHWQFYAIFSSYKDFPDDLLSYFRNLLTSMMITDDFM